VSDLERLVTGQQQQITALQQVVADQQQQALVRQQDMVLQVEGLRALLQEVLQR
jgi:hypothetical protein